ncbi:hypothetical protein [Paraburkholderia sediminicola]|uniref:hypothetical protein n=1 Tax=Paraburkholderia sediminicola TaxID=458836 RepID=UPI0038B99707
MNHMKLSYLLVVLLFSVTAHATSTPTPGGGQGGAGGSAIAGASAGVTGSGNSRNTNRNTNANLNAQGQQQGQKQGQQQSANNRQSQTAAGGKSSATGGQATQSMDGANQQSVNSSYRAAASTAYAPAIYPTAPCMGSSAIGGQGMSFGFSVGTAWKDEDCNFREDIRTVAVVLGDVQTAEEMECGKAAYREARARMARPCRDVMATSQASAQPVEYRDPFVRRRLGLPPLTD